MNLLLAAALAIWASSACRNLEVVTNSYATLAEARQAGAVERGWLPDIVPAGAHEIREAHDETAKARRWGLFSFGAEDTTVFRNRLGGEIDFAGIGCDAPARIEWWPILLRGKLDPERVGLTGLKGYRATNHGLVFAVNWNQRRAYYWSPD